MKRLLLIFLVVIGLGVAIRWKENNKILLQDPIIGTKTPQQKDIAAIRSFMNNPSLELLFVNTDLPTQYFRVGKVTKIGNGENMEAVDGRTRQVNVYDQKDLINDTCSVYEFNTDPRNNVLTAVIIRGLKSSEIENLKSNGITCSSNLNVPKISKSKAENIAMDYLKRVLPNFAQIIGQFVYSNQNNGGSHEWLWQDKNYQLPEGLSSRPYLTPIIRISVYGKNEIQYWNTTSLFVN